MTRWQDKIYDRYTGSLAQYHNWRITDKRPAANGQYDIDIFNEQTGQKQTLNGVGKLSISHESNQTYMTGPYTNQKIRNVAIGTGTPPPTPSMITPRGAAKVTLYNPAKVTVTKIGDW